MSRPGRVRRRIGTAGAAVVVGAAVIVWWGDGWIAHAPDVAILTVMFLVATAISARWE